MTTRRKPGIALCSAALAAALALPAIATAQPRDLALRVLSSGMCLVARAGWGERPVVQVPCQNYSDQDWVLEYLGVIGDGVEGQVRIRNVDRNLCLVTRGSGESKAVATTCGYFADQLWWVLRDPLTGYYSLMNSNSVSGTPMCLVVRTANPETQAVQSPCNRRYADQLWIWEGWF